MTKLRLDGLTIVAIAFFVFLIVNVIRDHFPNIPDVSGGAMAMVVDSMQPKAKSASLLAAEQPEPTPEGEQTLIGPSDSNPFGGDGSNNLIQPVDPNSLALNANLEGIEGDQDAFADPYPNYIVTQGPHGMSYGHNAVDITAGNGAEIHSPINGIVSAVYIDQYGNTTLVIENNRYRVLMLHGNYTVQTGQPLAMGEVVGTESNHGYTLDANGQICTGRDCGYHTHLNVFDKTVNSNVNPFDLLTK